MYPSMSWKYTTRARSEGTDSLTSIHRYLENTVVPTLKQALTEMCIQEPEDPICWLAQVKDFAEHSCF